MLNLKVNYSVTRAELEKAIFLDNKKSGVIKKRNILAIILAIIFLACLVYIIISPTFFITYILMVLSLLSIAFIFFYQKHNDKKYIDKMSNNWTNFSINVTNNSIEICDPTNINNKKRYYTLPFNGTLVVYETSKLFVYIFKGKSVFLTPKRVLTLDQIVSLHDIYKDNAKNNFFMLDNLTGKEI